MTDDGYRMRTSLGTSAAGPGRFPNLDWTIRLAPLSNGPVTLREVATRDAAALLAHLNAPAVRRHMAPAPPDTIDGFERFIRWTQTQRRAGALACFAIMPLASREAAGIIQIWRVTADFAIAEWGIALGEPWWGRGIGQAAARLLFSFAFETLKVRRLEARTGSNNARGRNLMTRLDATLQQNTLPLDGQGVSATDEELWTLAASRAIP
jgi:RimJ/RimL family protein N-acetyltransferase